MMVERRYRFTSCSVFLTLLLALITMNIFLCDVRADDTPLRVPAPISSGCEIDYPPFCFVGEDGQANGFSIELLRAALKVMERDVTFRTGPWAEVKGWLENGEVQALPLVGRTPEREALFDFTFPYMSLHGAIVVRQGTTGIRTLDDLRGRQVAVMKGDNAEEFMRREDRGITLHTTETFERALQELAQGLHDAVVIQRLVALRLIRQTGLTTLEIVNKPIDGFRQDWCFAVRDGDRETLALLNEGLSLVMADGTCRHLHAKWFAALELPSHSRIVVGGDSNYPPFEYLDDNGQPAGFVVDLTRAIARETGLDLEFRLGPWASVVEGLENGRIDVIQGMFYSPERDLKFDFTPAYSVNQYVSVVRRDRGPAPETLAELQGRTLVVQKGDVIYDFAVKNGLEARISRVESQEDALREVAEGKVDCALLVRISSLYLIKKNAWTNLVLGRSPLLSTEYCYAVADNHKALLAQFSEGLKILQETGQYRRIYSKWMGIHESPSTDFTIILGYVALVAVPLILLLLGFSLWSWALRKQVAGRTAELKESEEKFRLLFENMINGFALHKLIVNEKSQPADYVFMDVNPAFERLTGLKRENILGRTVTEILPGTENDPADWIGRYGRVALTGEETRFEHYSQALGKWFSILAFSPRKGQFATLFTDITGRKLSEQRIEHLNRVLRSIRDVNQLIVRERSPEVLIREICRLLVDNRGYASALIVLTDKNNRPVSWARSGLVAASETLDTWLESFRLPPCCQDGNPGKTVMLKGDSSEVCCQCPIAGEFAGTRSLCIGLIHEGRTFGYLVAALNHDLTVDEEEEILSVEMGFDIAYALSVLEMEADHEASERKRELLQNQLVQAQKMESVGRLAGGVAHDYNNMLSIIIGNAELCLERVTPGDLMHEDLMEILAAAKRSADITKQLLAFARRQTIAPRVLDLNDTIDSMLKMLRRLIGEDIDLSWVPGAALPPVRIDPSQVDQILANLCVNARDAIQGVGRITIETGNCSFDEAYCSDHKGFVPGDYVMLAVSDDGRGMTPETLNSIFEPFFTTKGLGKGTGMGLATVYGIVKQNSGFINVYSELSKGTTIKVYFPEYAGQNADPHPGKPPEDPRASGETVLLVEDDASILKLGTRILMGLGYTVLAAATPGEAVTLAEKHQGVISLLITDVVMPDMNGRDLSEKLKKICPDLKVLFMSGYTADVIARRGILEHGVSFMPKPFSRNDMAEKVRTILDGPRAGSTAIRDGNGQGFLRQDAP
ncbi:MAG: transporter substrate-binding domain-containing protein [Pseudomonadota bacterium]